MKSTVVALACLLAVAYAQFGNGQYFPNNQAGGFFNRFNNRNQGQYNQGQYNPYNRYQDNPFYNNRYVSSTFAPKPSLFASSTAAPAVTATAAAEASATVAPVVQAAQVPAFVAGRVVSDARTAETVSYTNEINPDGSFSYSYEANNGIAGQAQGAPRNFGEVAPVVIQGSFSWVAPDGQVVTMTYVADENGYQPSGDAIPRPPPIPEAILRSLEYIARNAPITKTVEQQ